MDDAIFDVITKHIFNGCEKWIFDKTAFFSDVYGEDMLQVVFAGALDPRDRSTYYSPTNSEILEFLNNHPTISCHGTVKVDDGNPVISIEGFYSTQFSDSDREDFLKFVIYSDIIRDNLYPPILYNKW